MVHPPSIPNETQLIPILVGAPTLYAMLALYLLLAAASMGVGWFASPRGQLRQQVNSWWYLFPVVSLSLLFSTHGPILLTLLISMLGAHELTLHCTGQRWRLVVPFGLLMAIQTTLTLNGTNPVELLLPGLIAAQALHFIYRRQINSLLLLTFMLLTYSLSFIPRFLEMNLSGETQMAWLFYLFTLTALNDIAQFVSGTCLGKRRICAQISPNKTWAGLMGGVLVSLAVSVTLGRYLRLAEIDTLLALAVLLSVGGFFGDILFSKVKRCLGIKDFSNLIPGHGGILDRVDSLVLTAPLLYLGLTL